jgi:hypothetical protein
MKYKTTAAQLRNNYYRIISIGYCDADDLLQYQTPSSYTCGIYGWNSDNYHISNSTLISTGYRPLSDRNARHDYNLLMDYNNMAREINSARDLSHDEKVKAINALLYEFVEKVSI